MQKDKQFMQHLSHLMIDINEKLTVDKENLENFNFQQFSYKVKSFNKNKHQKQIEFKFRKTAQSFETKNKQNPLQDFEFVNDYILPLQNISFSKEEAKLINNALKHFKQQEKKSYQFFGKILGTQKDYVIIFTNDPKKSSEEEIEQEEQVPKNWEDKGVNKFEFRVLQNDFDQWKKLDKVSPQQIRQSRHLNIYMSGDLNKDLSERGFKGTEENYLSCQLIRILSACYCVPSNYYKFEEEIKDIQVDQESMSAFYQNKDDTCNLENWAHKFPIILKSGRVKHFIPSHRNEEEREQLKDELDENDPNCDRLRTLNEDTENLWKFKYYGSNEFYVERDDEDEEKQKQIGNVVLTNNNWFGAMNIFSVNYQTYVFLYLGYGFKNPLISLQNKVCSFQSEPKQRKEQIEPNHYEEPEPEKDEDENQEEDAEENQEEVEEEDDQQVEDNQDQKEEQNE